MKKRTAFEALDEKNTASGINLKGDGSEIIILILQADNHFARLDLPLAPTTADLVRKRYRKRALRCHPDKNDHPQAKKAFQLLSESFDLFHDLNQQREYIAQERRKRQQGPKPLKRQKRRSEAARKAQRDRSKRTSSWYQRARSWQDVEAELLRRERMEKKFLSAMSRKWSGVRAQQLLRQAQVVCRNLDERVGVKKNLLWRQLEEQEAQVAVLRADDSPFAEHVPPPLPPSADSVKSQLFATVEYLHRKHCYHDMDDDLAEEGFLPKADLGQQEASTGLGGACEQADPESAQQSEAAADVAEAPDVIAQIAMSARAALAEQAEMNMLPWRCSHCRVGNMPGTIVCGTCSRKRT